MSGLQVRFLPTQMNKRMKGIDKEIRASLKGIINKREKATEGGGEGRNDDLLGILMESNSKEIQEHGNNKNVGMSLNDVIEECKPFILPAKRRAPFCWFGPWLY